MQGKTHWENIYRTKDASQVSWFQEHPELSVQFIKRTGISKTAQIIDVGGGASTLVDDLLADGYERVTVLDISGVALELSKQRLGSQAVKVTWIEGDIRNVELPSRFYDVWHDRAVFHFLTRVEDRAQYIKTVRQSVKEGGHVIVATFGLEGPLRCSGLDVVRYSPGSLHDEFGDEFQLVKSATESHHTPFGTEQEFIYCYCRMS